MSRRWGRKRRGQSQGGSKVRRNAVSVKVYNSRECAELVREIRITILPPSNPAELSVATAPTPSGKRSRWRVALLLLLLLALILSARWLGLGVQVDALRSWVQSFGALAPLLFVALYAAGTVAAVPGSVMTVMAGTLFGAALGIAVVSGGATLGASLAFLAARYVARDAVARRFSGLKWFQRLDRLSEERGAWVVALTRLLPLFPFNLLNYAFGLTRIRFRTYIFWSWLCMLPGATVYVVGSDAVFQIIRGHVSWALVGVLAASTAALFLLIRFARRSLQKIGLD